MTKDVRINSINIGLMVLSCLAAFIMPFEVFLFAYAFLGPLHYLTEISWLHDKQYFTKGKYDFLVLLIVGILLTIQDLAYNYNWIGMLFTKNEWTELEDAPKLLQFLIEHTFYYKIMFFCLISSILMIFVKNALLKIIGLLFLFIISNAIFPVYKNDNLAFFLGALLPTLVHVFVFTGFFILFGALKSRSKSGMLSFFIFLLCPVLLFLLFKNYEFVSVTQYGKDSMVGKGHGFFSLNTDLLEKFFNVEFVKTNDGIDKSSTSNLNLVFKSSNGILIMRFIAFAYTYHYLNWFSKTEIIRWHKVPKVRFLVVIALWISSLVIYAINYSLGLQVLFFLSFCHVLLEFPLNWVSIIGIGKEGSSILKYGFKAKTAKAV
jgi:hypothetical protein